MSERERENVVRRLEACSDEELREVFSQVFKARRPYPAEEAYHHNRYFLGVASRQLAGEPQEPERWEPAAVYAVADVDRSAYGDGPGPDVGFSQFGTCDGCGVKVCSNLKQGLCPICGEPVSMS